MFSPSNLTDQNSEPQTPIPAASLDWSSKESISARASIVGERLALKSLESFKPLATNPLIVAAGANGCVVLLRYGAIVTFNLSMEEESILLKTIESHIRDPLKATASEVLAIAFRPNVNDARVEIEIIPQQPQRFPRATSGPQHRGDECAGARFRTDRK